jgi:hypothetical protein
MRWGLGFTFSSIILFFSCSDDQKERYREAAKARRSKETEYFKELENLLPVSKEVHETEKSLFDKISLIRFSCIIFAIT